MKAYAVIMAGGGGTRFWPLSRQNLPKQMLNLSGNDALINETIKRYDGVIDIENTFIVTSQSQGEPLNTVLIDGVPRENILLEPMAKNTAPCILYAALKLYRMYGDGIMCVLPADHYITDNTGYKELLSNAILLAKSTDKLITIGIKPTFASTGYGYIKHSNEKAHDIAYNVVEFVEKPHSEVAKQYIQSGNYLWNSGMFVWKTSVIIESFKRYLPRLYDSFNSISATMDTDDSYRAISEIYPELQSISIDYGIMERSNDVLVLKGDFGWNDVGSWDALGALFPTDKDGNIVRAEHVGVDTNDCIIYSEDKLVATIGLNNMIVVNTKDALLVCDKEKAQEVKSIVNKLKELKKYDLL